MSCSGYWFQAVRPSPHPRVEDLLHQLSCTLNLHAPNVRVTVTKFCLMTRHNFQSPNVCNTPISVTYPVPTPSQGHPSFGDMLYIEGLCSSFQRPTVNGLFIFGRKRKCAENKISFSAPNKTENFRSFSAENETGTPT